MCLFFLAVAVTEAPAYAASSCTAKDREAAQLWGNAYKPEDAYAFGLRVQNLLKAKDLQGIFHLVHGELQNGPRRVFALSKTFDEVFDAGWVNSVLSEKPMCSPVGWRGFMLGRGLIWYKKVDGKWQIFSMNGAAQEEVIPPSVGWKVYGALLRPSCFTRVWESGDNFEEFAERFKVLNYAQFTKQPGAFFGREVKTYTLKRPSWCTDPDDDCKPLSLVKSVSRCSVAPPSVEVRGHEIWTKIDGLEAAYTVLRTIDGDQCSALAPNIGAKCVESYLVQVGEYAGGSMGWDTSYGIYGVFDLDGLGLSVVPLQYFDTRNDALNFVLSKSR